MVFVGERCLKTHRIMFIILGIWPYEQPYIWIFQILFFFGIFFGSLSSQLAIFLTTMHCNMDCLLKRFSYFCITSICATNYYSLYFNSEAVRQIFERIQLDWKLFKPIDTTKIFERYLFEAYIFLYFVHFCGFIGGFVFMSMESGPLILDVIMPLNESRSRETEIEFEFFLDRDKYYVLYVVLEVVALSFSLCSLITTGTFFFTMGKHFCATHKIASCLIENAMNIYTLQLPTSEGVTNMHQTIYLSVSIHRRTIEFIKAMLLYFDLWYFPLLLIGVVSLSCIFFRLYYAAIQLNDLYDIFVSCMLLLLCLLYMFMANVLGQSYTEHSIEILECLYNSLWYVAPLSIQKLFLIMQKSMKSHKIVMANIFVMSIEGFSTLLTSSMSYFTVMHAMRS